MISVDSRHLINVDGEWKRLYLDLHDDGTVTWRGVPLEPYQPIHEHWDKATLTEQTMD